MSDKVSPVLRNFGSNLFLLIGIFILKCVEDIGQLSSMACQGEEHIRCGRGTLQNVKN